MNTSRCYRSVAGSLLVLVAMSVGCSEYDATVSGVVQLDGTPLDHGKVMYVGEGTGVMAIGKIDSSGDYEVQVATSGGLPSGEYQVKVICQAPAAPSVGGAPPAPGKSLIPRKYARGLTSGLQFTVEPGSNTIDLELSSAE